jgi:hypothetical protein
LTQAVIYLKPRSLQLRGSSLMNTSGFYRLRDDKLTRAPKAVRAPTYDLFREDKDNHTYPVDGWYWFDSETDAKEFFNIPQDTK